MGVDDLSEVIRSLDKTAQGEFTMRLLIAAKSEEQLHAVIPAVHRQFVDARAQAMEETLGNLSAFYTMFPANGKFNIFPLWLAENHHARMSSVFAPHIGHMHSEDLDAEYLNVFETRTRTPFFQDAYVNGVRVKLVLGPTGSGKSVLINQEAALERKYNGFTVRSVDARANTLTVDLENGSTATYDPRRLRGVNVYRETTREFSSGDRVQFTAPDKNLGVANRDLGTVVSLEDGKFAVRLDGKEDRTVAFDPNRYRQFDHGYAVTSHSAQGLTSGRVIANIDTDSAKSLINTRLAYVSISRASHEARIYTNDAETLGERLATDVTKTAAVDFRPPSPTELTRVHEYANRDSRLAAVALDYAAQPDRTVIVASDSADRRELTRLIRSDLQAQGRIGPDSRSVPVLVQRDLANKMQADNYRPGDEIHYKTGSPALIGIPHNGAATVLSIDGDKNLLTVETRDGGQLSYNPAQLRRQTAESTVYREETRELAGGDRIRFTSADRENRLRTGDFATVERIGGDNGITARLDSGREVELNPEKARHIDHGYTVEHARHLSADRILLTGESGQLAEQQAALTRLNPHTREIGIYTSDMSNPLQQAQGIAARLPLAEEGVSLDPVSSMPEVEFEGFGLGL